MKDDTTKRDGVGVSLLSGAFAIGWAAVVSIAAVPWYLRLLGIDSYGLIGFFATLQAAISLLDLGLGATINREVARSSALGDLDPARRLLRSLEWAYAVAAAIIAAAIVAGAPLIASHWLGTSALDRGQMVDAIRLMGVIAALRWPFGLYAGALIGLHRAQISYRITAAITTLANFGAIAVLVWINRTIWAYFVWQALVALVFVGWARRSAWREIGGARSAMFDPALLRTILVQSAVMSGVSLSGLVLTQLDKIVVSASTSLAEFGRYSLAAVAATGLSILIIPTFNVIYPRLSALVATGKPDERVRFYRLGTRLFLSVLAPVALSAFFYAEDVLAVWTGNAGLAVQTAPIMAWLCLGSAANGLMLFPYAMQLATGQTKLPLVMNCALIIVMVPLAIALVAQFGALGGAFAWFALNAIFILLGTVATARYVLPGVQGTWLMRDVAPALIVASAVVGAGRLVAEHVDTGHVVRLAIASACALVAMAMLMLGYRDARDVMTSGIKVAGARLRHRWGGAVVL